MIHQVNAPPKTIGDYVVDIVTAQPGIKHLDLATEISRKHDFARMAVLKRIREMAQENTIAIGGSNRNATRCVYLADDKMTQRIVPASSVPVFGDGIKRDPMAWSVKFLEAA